MLQEYAEIRAGLDSLNSNFLSRSGEFNVRMSSLELAQKRLAASVDAAHTKIDRIELDIKRLKEQQAATVDRLNGVDAKLDLILARLEDCLTPGPKRTTFGSRRPRPRGRPPIRRSPPFSYEMGF